MNYEILVLSSVLAVFSALVLIGFVWLRPRRKTVIASSANQPLVNKPLSVGDACVYYSRKYGLREGTIVGQDGSGRMVIQLFHPLGVFVRRQPHLVEALN